MPKTTEDQKNNIINIEAEDFDDISGLIMLEKDENSLRIGPRVRASTINIRMGGHASLFIHGDCILGHLDIYLASGSSLVIGSGCAFNGVVNMYQHEAGSMVIGSNCLFGGNILLTTSDMHSILDLRNGQRLNPAQNIMVGEHVWLGAGVTVLKGVSIGDGSVAGAYSVITKSIRPNCLVAGNPATLVREGIDWTHNLL